MKEDSSELFLSPYLCVCIFSFYFFFCCCCCCCCCCASSTGRNIVLLDLVFVFSASVVFCGASQNNRKQRLEKHSDNLTAAGSFGDCQRTSRNAPTAPVQFLRRCQLTAKSWRAAASQSLNRTRIDHFIGFIRDPVRNWNWRAGRKEEREGQSGKNRDRILRSHSL